MFVHVSNSLIGKLEESYWYNATNQFKIKHSHFVGWIAFFLVCLINYESWMFAQARFMGKSREADEVDITQGRVRQASNSWGNCMSE